MSVDPRGEIWDAGFNTWYDAKYNVELATRMVDRLKAIDDVTKVLVALTASGSVVAGWSLWSRSSCLAAVWATLAGGAAGLSIVHGTLGIPGRLKEWLEIKRDYLGLAIDLESFRYQMRISPDFDIEKFQQGLETFRTRHAVLEGRIPSDLFMTRKLETRCQDNVDILVKAEKEVSANGRDERTTTKAATDASSEA